MDALRFLHAGILNFIWLVFPLSAFLFYSIKKRRDILARFADVSAVSRLVKGISTQRVVLKYALAVLAFVFIVVALARPQLGTKEEYIVRQGLDIFVCLDVSKSMLAQDIKPNRLIKAKHEIEKLIDILQGDRIGLVVFAGNSLIQCPLTLDYGAAKMFLDVVSPGMVSRGGTSVESAIKTAIGGFVASEKKHKVVIILTDGEGHEDDPVSAANTAMEEGVVIYTIGIGSTKGEPIPEKNMGYQKDEDGNVVMSRLDEDILRDVALKTGGKYFRSSGEEKELKGIYDRISKMEKKEVASKQFTQFEERFQYPLALALLLIALELMLPERNKSLEEWSGRFE